MKQCSSDAHNSERTFGVLKVCDQNSVEEDAQGLDPMTGSLAQPVARISQRTEGSQALLDQTEAMDQHP